MYKKHILYKPRYNYGLDQLNKEINVKDRTSINEFGATHYSYNDSGLLASAIENLREKLKKILRWKNSSKIIWIWIIKIINANKV